MFEWSLAEIVVVSLAAVFWAFVGYCIVVVELENRRAKAECSKMLAEFDAVFAGSDGAALEPSVPVEVVYAKAGDSASIPFVVPKAVCDAVRSGEQPAFVFVAGLGLAERN